MNICISYKNSKLFCTLITRFLCLRPSTSTTTKGLSSKIASLFPYAISPFLLHEEVMGLLRFRKTNSMGNIHWFRFFSPTRSSRNLPCTYMRGKVWHECEAETRKVVRLIHCARRMMQQQRRELELVRRVFLLPVLYTQDLISK